jgi:hypothetical protein
MILGYCVNFVGLLVVITGLLLQSGCAASYTDDKGNHHIIGFVHLEITPDKEQSKIAGNSIEVSNIGLQFSAHEHQQHLSVGYASEKTTYLKNNILLGLPELNVATAPESASDAQVLHGSGLSVEPVMPQAPKIGSEQIPVQPHINMEN